jgi:hypothetical protein
MTNLNLPPLQVWVRPGAKGVLEIVNPLLGGYDPNRPDAYIQADPNLAEGLNYIDDNAGSLRVQLSLGPLDEATDLPRPWLEERVASADMFGHNVDPSLSAQNGHYHRIMNYCDELDRGTMWVGDKAIKKYFCYAPELETVNGSADTVLRAMHEHVETEYETNPDQDIDGLAVAAGIVAMNSLSWYAVAKIGLAASRYNGGQKPLTGEWTAFVPMVPELWDTARKLGLLGVAVEEEKHRRFADSWVQDPEMIDTRNIMATGKIQ